MDKIEALKAEIEKMPEVEKKERNIMIGDKIYTPEEILDHISRRTEIGMMFIEAGST